MRRTLLFGVCLGLGAMACQEQLADPTTTSEVATAGVTMGVEVAPDLHRAPTLLVSGDRFKDAIVVDPIADGAINGGDYVCSSTQLIDDVNAAFDAIFADPFELAIAQALASLAAFDLPQLEALVFLEESREVAYGYNGEFTDQTNRAIKSLRRFWDIESDGIHVVPMKGSMLQDAERVAALYQSPLLFSPPLSEADAFLLAGQIQSLLDLSNLLNGGDHPAFAFNAFAFEGIPFLGLPPKIVLGDATFNMYADIGFGDVAPQAVLAHEWAHHIQFQNGYFDDPVPTFDPAGPNQAEATRYTELMADAMAAYYLTHSRGETLRQQRVEQFLEVYFQIGDCSFASPGHHGTPNQRMAAAHFGFDLAAAAKKQGEIMSSEDFHDAFVAAYFTLIAPDA